MHVSTRFLRTAIGPVALSLVLAGCGATDDPDAGGDTSAKAVTIENCGEELTFESPPERVVAYYQHPAELLVALGLADRVVGMAYPDNDPLARYASAYEQLELISEQDASFEQLLKAEPDLVYGGYSSAFDDSSGRSRKAFADAGIRTYLNREECWDGEVSLDLVYEEIATLGEIFGVQDRAEALVGDLKTEVAETETALKGVEPLDVFVFDSGEDAPYTSGGTGISNQVIEAAGGRNIFADLEENWAEVSWEQVIQRRPDVIAIYDYYGTPSVEEKKELLLSRPELAEVPAIRDERFVTLTLQDAVLGIRAPYAVRTLAEQLHPDAVS